MSPNDKFWEQYLEQFAFHITLSKGRFMACDFTSQFSKNYYNADREIKKMMV